jgi:N-acetylmuramoyl-L-alanine amidase
MRFAILAVKWLQALRGSREGGCALGTLLLALSLLAVALPGGAARADGRLTTVAATGLHRALDDAAAAAARPGAVIPLPLPRPGTALGPDTAGARGRTRPVVVIDPGHGGVDPGAIGVNGVMEKTLTLAVALELRRLLESSGRYRVVLTRSDDEYVGLRERIARARHARGDLFLSLHADSVGRPHTRGASVYTLSERASDAEAERLAAQENKADIIAGADLGEHDAVVATILIDLAQRGTKNKAVVFADLVAEEIGAVTPLLRRHRRFAGFAVLKAPDIPSVLIELGYLSNASDARKLASAAHQQRMVRAIVRAVDRYFSLSGS